MNDPDIQYLISLSKKAAEHILTIYRQPIFDVRIKLDKSLLTQADIESQTIICDELKKRYPAIPVISEESTKFHDYASRKNLEIFFLVDPLDGTKEFVHRRDEFTINIALIYKGQPVLGVIHAPALNVIYYAEQKAGAYKIAQDKKIKLPICTQKNADVINVAVSRSHFCEETENFIASLKKEKQVNLISAGSALKFGLVAEGHADFYPRFTPTMEWDTAAGHVLINEVGKMIRTPEGQELQYNKLSLQNPGFIVQSFSHNISFFNRSPSK